MVKKTQLFSEQVSDHVYALLISFKGKTDKRDRRGKWFPCLCICLCTYLMINASCGLLFDVTSAGLNRRLLIHSLGI